MLAQRSCFVWIVASATFAHADLDAGIEPADEAASEAENLADPPASIEPQVSREEAEAPTWQNYDPRREGVGIALASLEAAVLDPNAAGAQKRALGFGCSAQVVGRRRSWPLSIGLAIGIISFQDQSATGPFFVGQERDGSFYTGSTMAHSAVQLRHAELVTRIQPWWWIVRPYVDGQFGLVSLWNDTTLRDKVGATIASREQQRSISYLAGIGIGADIRVLQLSEDTINVWELLLSMGAKRTFTGDMESPVYRAAESSGVTAEHAHSRLRIWQPYVSIGLATRSKPRPVFKR